MSKLSGIKRNPLSAARTSADFLARWPGATCVKFAYDADLYVYVLRLQDGTLVGTGINEGDLWDKGVSLMEHACPVRQKQVTVPGPWARPAVSQVAA